jgi:hypothetical protein
MLSIVTFTDKFHSLAKRAKLGFFLPSGNLNTQPRSQFRFASQYSTLLYVAHIRSHVPFVIDEMALPWSQSRSFPSIEVDSNHSCALHSKFQVRYGPDNTRRTHFSYYDPDLENDCGSLVVSGVYTLAGSITSSSTTDS